MAFLNRKKALFAAVLLAVAATSAQADNKRSAEYDACMDAVDYSAMKNSQMSECIQAELARQDKTLNAVYKNLRNNLSAEQKNLLLQGQRAWLTYRENWCRFDEQGNTAPGGVVNYNLCMLDLTDTQIRLIEEQ